MTLGKAYDAIMERLEVTPEMRERALRRVREAGIAPARPGPLPFPAWRRYLSAAACLAVLIAGALALPRLLAPEEQDPPVLLPPVVEEAASREELSALVGFEVAEDPALPFQVDEVRYCAIGGELAQVSYAGPGGAAVYRQSPGSQDVSGDYNDYEDVIQAPVGGRTVTLKGSGGSYVLALWTDGASSFSLRLDPGAPEEAWLAILGP